MIRDDVKVGMFVTSSSVIGGQVYRVRDFFYQRSLAVLEYWNGKAWVSGGVAYCRSITEAQKPSGWPERVEVVYETQV